MSFGVNNKGYQSTSSTSFTSQLQEDDFDLDEVTHDVVASINAGDVNVVTEALNKNIIKGDSLDSDGCSLLHWAAINDQLEIAKLLIDNKANVNYAGGILQEIPLQWAIRKGNYEMILYLIEKGSNLAHKSVQNTDSIHLACRIGDVRTVYILLSSGANPDSTDGCGLTCLYYLISQKRTLNLQYLDIIRILLQFKADARVKDPSNGNNILHFLGIHGMHSNPVTTGLIKGSDGTIVTNNKDSLSDLKSSATSNQNNMLTIAYMIQSSAGASITMDKNDNGLTPYQLANKHNNSKLVKFLTDFLYLSATPFLSPVIVAASLILLFTVLALYYNVVISGSVVLLLYVFIGRHFLQWTVVQYRHRFIYGAMIGFLLSLYLVYYWSYRVNISLLTNTFFSFIFIIELIMSISIHVRKPVSLKPWENEMIVKFIIDSERTSKSQEKSLINGSVDTQVQQQAHIATDSRICWSCLAVVKKNHSHSSSSTSTSFTSSFNTRSLRDYSNSGPISHCRHCNKCVVARDHHNPVINNCVGNGNRREYVYFLLTTIVFVSMFIIFTIRHLIYYGCTDYSLLSCLFYNEFRYSLFLFTSCFVAIMTFFHCYVQILFVAKGVTVLQWMKHQVFPSKSKSLTTTQLFSNVWQFLTSGNYRVLSHKNRSISGKSRSNSLSSHSNTTTSNNSNSNSNSNISPERNIINRGQSRPSYNDDGLFTSDVSKSGFKKENSFSGDNIMNRGTSSSVSSSNYNVGGKLQASTDLDEVGNNQSDYIINIQNTNSNSNSNNNNNNNNDMDDDVISDDCSSAGSEEYWSIDDFEYNHELDPMEEVYYKPTLNGHSHNHSHSHAHGEYCSLLTDNKNDDAYYETKPLLMSERDL